MLVKQEGGLLLVGSHGEGSLFVLEAGELLGEGGHC